MQPVKTIILDTVQPVAVEQVRLEKMEDKPSKPKHILELMDEYRSLSMSFVNNYSSLSVDEVNEINYKLEMIRDRCAPYCRTWIG